MVYICFVVIKIDKNHCITFWCIVDLHQNVKNCAKKRNSLFICNTNQIYCLVLSLFIINLSLIFEEKKIILSLISTIMKIS